MKSRCTKISAKSGRGLGHVTSTIFGSTVGYPSDSLASCCVFCDYPGAPHIAIASATCLSTYLDKETTTDTRPIIFFVIYSDHVIDVMM